MGAELVLPGTAGHGAVLRGHAAVDGAAHQVWGQSRLRQALRSALSPYP